MRTTPTLRQAGEAWLEQARAGVIRASNGYPYKPATVRAYERALRRRANPALGTEPLDQISRADLQELVDEVNAQGLAATTIETTLNVIRAIYRHEVGRDRIRHNPTRGVALPSGGGRRERFATPAEAKALIAALPEDDRAIWATAFYAGLRRGELLALRARAIDFDAARSRWWPPGTRSRLSRRPRDVPVARCR